MGSWAGPSGPRPGARLSPEEFGAATNVSRETLARFERYADLLEKWTRSINLVGRDSLADLWRRHMLDSAQLLPLLPPAPAGRERVLVDLGSGAGFPGLVLAILGAGEVHLIESDGRKAAFLHEAARETGAEVTLHNRRIEALPTFAADVVTARACAPLPKLLGYAAAFVRSADAEGPGGTALFLKGRRVDEELTDSLEKWKMRVERFPSRSDPEGTILRVEFLDMGESAR